jgi:hypothetical protein
VRGGYKHAHIQISQQKDITGYAGVVNDTSATLLQKPGFSGYVECTS